MSELTPCNYYSLKAIKWHAKKEGKIRKRKAIFRVEFEVYSCDSFFEQICNSIDLQLRMLPETIHGYTPPSMPNTPSMTGLAKVIPSKVRRIAR